MLTRIISALVASVAFIAVVYFMPPVAFTIAIACVAAIIAYELTWQSKIVKTRVLSISACVFAAAMPFFTSMPLLEPYVFALLFACVAVSFAIWIFAYGKVSYAMVMTSIFGGAILPLLLSMIVRIRNAENGQFWILLPFLAAWMTDIGAYFVGVLLGKHKLCETISPKKTVEGSVGGVALCTVSLFVFSYAMKLSVNPCILVIGAILLSVLAQIGDLSFSVIKREYNIKDYGTIMPGHGGLLDRFDSAMFTIPASYIFLNVIGGIV